jgi:DNA repair exonuclease SbcCD nuclease subunit
MIKKIVHTADWHIRTMRMHGEYKEVFNTLISDLKKLLIDYKREEVRIVIAGDLVHNKTVISNEQLIFSTWVLLELEKIAPLIIIAGNHDLNLNNKDRMDSITPMVQFLPDANINYFKESLCYLDNNIVWCVYSIFEENERPDIESARVEFGDDKTYIGLFHGPLVGSTTDIGYEIEHGYGLEIFDGCDIVICGDIHKRQKITYKSIPIVMSSSLIQQGFGENVSKHGFLFWDVESKTFTEHDVDNRFPYYQFKIKSLEDIDNGSEIITNL